MRESCNNSTGRTQITEIKKQKWIWKEAGETNGTCSNEKGNTSKEEIESFMNIEEMNGINEFRNHNKKYKKSNLNKGVEIGGRVKKKNRYSVPVKSNVFKNENSVIKEVSEEAKESFNEEARESQRTLEESLKVLKDHLVKEINGEKKNKIKGFNSVSYTHLTLPTICSV